MTTCIFCRDVFDDAPPEHVFSMPLGHTYEIRLICGNCNNRFGQEFDHRPDRDAIVNFARHRLGLTIRQQSVKSASDVDTGLEAVIDSSGRPEIKTQRDGLDLVVGEGAMSKQLLQMLRSRFKGVVPDKSIIEMRDRTLADWIAAPHGGVVEFSAKGTRVSLTKVELAGGTTVTFHDDPNAIDRTAYKIAFEFAADQLGPEKMLQPEYDRVRQFVRTGEKQPQSVRVVRKPAPDGSDLERRHRISLHSRNNELIAHVTLFGTYTLDVVLGPVPLDFSEVKREFVF